jgi:HK97 family phage portal protein
MVDNRIMGLFDRWFKKKEPKLRKQYAAITTSSMGRVKWSDKDYENFAKEAYIKNVIAYRCIYEIAKAGAQVEWNIYREKNDKKEKVTGTPYDHLLRRPNHEDSFGFLQMKTISFWNIAGNTYYRQIRRQTGEEKGVPLELHVMRPDKMSKVLNDDGDVIRYEYKKGIGKPDEYPVDPNTGDSDILQIKQFHPTDDLYGLSPVEPGSMVIDTNNEATRWNMRMLQNEARIGLVYLFQGILDEKDYDKMVENIRQFEGADNAGKSLILESEIAVDVKPYAWNPKEIDFIEGWRQTARSTCFAFGMPPQLVGIPGDNTYSNYKEARQSLWEETNLFVLNYIKGEMNNWLFKTDEQFSIGYDTNKVPALAEKRTMLWKRAEESTFMTLNEKRKMVGLDSVPGGDVILIPANMIPLGEPVPEEPKEPGKLLNLDDKKARELMDIRDIS